MKDYFSTFFREANLGPRLEEGDLLDGREKPVDILIHVWDADRDLCVDVSINSLFDGGGAILVSREAARKLEKMKISRYEASCSANGLILNLSSWSLRLIWRESGSGDQDMATGWD